jgi:hypothetical protein
LVFRVSIDGGRVIPSNPKLMMVRDGGDEEMNKSAVGNLEVERLVVIPRRAIVSAR